MSLRDSCAETGDLGKPLHPSFAIYRPKTGIDVGEAALGYEQVEIFRRSPLHLRQRGDPHNPVCRHTERFLRKIDDAALVDLAIKYRQRPWPWHFTAAMWIPVLGTIDQDCLILRRRPVHQLGMFVTCDAVDSLTAAI